MPTGETKNRKMKRRKRKETKNGKNKIIKERIEIKKQKRTEGNIVFMTVTVSS